ncbi:MAG: serine/threonine protein kinase [Candidatus Melainabacteria bacterium]|nr:serine/threonine protein kinase [Candidatus Melainabacteria bacterium]
MIKRESKLHDETTKKVDIVVSRNVAGLGGDEEDECEVDGADETLLLEKDAKRTSSKKKKAADALTFAVINGRYELLGLAGQGGMASVYKARDLRDNKEVAVKVLDRDLANMDSVLERFQKEVAAASAMAHENLAAVYDSGVTEDGRPFIVMEYMRGQTLAQLLKKRAKLSLNEFADIFVQVAKGLAHAHRRGVVHRDIKPSNIMLYTDAKEKLGVKLLDFGIAKSLADIDETSLHLTHTGQVIGSPFYMSPEQCRALPVDTRSDIYSLGCVMFEAITGGVPFKGETALDTLYKHIHEPAPRVRANVPKLKAAEILASTIETTLMKQPEARYHTARELGKDLAKLTSWDDLPSELEFDSEPRKTEPIKEKSRFNVAGIAITTAIGLSMLVCGTMISNFSEGPSAQTPELAVADTSLKLDELWKLSEKELDDQRYDEAVKYAQRAEHVTKRASKTLPHAVSMLKTAMALYQKNLLSPQVDEGQRDKDMNVVQENLRKSLAIFNEYLDKNSAKSTEEIISALGSHKLPFLNRYYFEANGQLATVLADDYREHSEEAKLLFNKVNDLFLLRSETTHFPEAEAKQYLQSLTNLYFADKDYLNGARIQTNISEIWNERLIDPTSDPNANASFAGTWISPYKKTDSNMHLSLKQEGDRVFGDITMAVLPTRAIWKGTVSGVLSDNTSSATFNLTGTNSNYVADNSSKGGSESKAKSSIQGELSLTRYKNLLIVRLYNWSGDENITLSYAEVLQLKPNKRSADKKH